MIPPANVPTNDPNHLPNRPSEEPSLATGPQKIDGELYGLLQLASTATPAPVRREDAVAAAPGTAKTPTTPTTTPTASPSAWWMTVPALLIGMVLALAFLGAGGALVYLAMAEKPAAKTSVNTGVFGVEPPTEGVLPPIEVPVPEVVAPAPAPAPARAASRPRPTPKPTAEPVPAPAPAPAAKTTKPSEPAPVTPAPAPAVEPAPAKPAPAPAAVDTVPPPLKSDPPKEPEGYMGLPDDF